MFPNLEIHASTQANISSKDICKLYYDLGVKRVVFARELSIDEIDSIDVPIEKEAFIHGALCISYSGCCLMSSMLGGRSGNRGECAGCCRLPYSLKLNDKLLVKNKYLLSTKELNTSTFIERLLKSSIFSFKIEGRMKSPTYVGFITRFYRNLIDGKNINIHEELNNLKIIFNREFTKGRIFNENDKELMNIDSPNHKGLEIGKVLKIKKDKIKIKLFDNNYLHQYDAIRFLNSNEGFIVNYLYDKNMNLVNSSSDICYVDNKINLTTLDIITKTQDYLLDNKYKTLIEKKIPISFKIKALCNKKLFVEINDGSNKIIQEGDLVQKAINAPITKENIINQFSKLGDTPFVCEKIDVDMDNDIFISLKNLNELRRCLCFKLIELRQNIKNDFIQKKVVFNKINNIDLITGKTCSVYNEEQLKICIDLNFDRIYVNDKNLYNLYKDKVSNLYYMVPRCIFDVNSKLLEKNIVSDYAFYNNKMVIGNYTLNVTNIYTAYYLNRIGISSVCLSVELKEKEINEFVNLYNSKFGNMNFEVLIYGLVENMIIKGNILNIDSNNYNYILEDEKSRKFPVYYNNGNTHILNYENKNIDRSLLDNCTIRYDFYLENSNDIKKIVNK